MLAIWNAGCGHTIIIDQNEHVGSAVFRLLVGPLIPRNLLATGENTRSTIPKTKQCIGMAMETAGDDDAWNAAIRCPLQDPSRDGFVRDVERVYEPAFIVV
jgi:hypothetical protein